MTYDIHMKRMAIFLTDDLEHFLYETARRTRRSQAEIVREALSQYLQAQSRPWPRSIAMGNNSDGSVTSDNVKEWIHDQCDREVDEAPEAEVTPPSC